MEMPLLREGADFNSRIKSEMENLVAEALRSSANFSDNPKYDFNFEVCKPVESAVSPALNF